MEVNMSQMTVQRPNVQKLDSLGVSSWPIWQKKYQNLIGLMINKKLV